MQSGCRQSRCARSTCTVGRTYGSNATDYVDCWPVWGLMALHRGLPLKALSGLAARIGRGIGCAAQPRAARGQPPQQEARVVSCSTSEKGQLQHDVERQHRRLHERDAALAQNTLGRTVTDTRLVLHTDADEE